MDTQTSVTTKSHLGSTIMAIGGLGFVGYAAILLGMVLTGSFYELGIGPSEVDVTGDQVEEFSQDLHHYVTHVSIALPGFLAATGLAVASLSWFGVRTGQMWAWVSAVAFPVLALVVALPSHYPWGFDTIEHLGLVYADTALFTVGALLALRNEILQNAATQNRAIS